MGEPAAALLLGRRSELALDERLRWLEYGVNVHNVYCLALSGRLLLRRGKINDLVTGISRIAKAFGIAISGLTRRDLREIDEDPRIRQ